MLSRAASVAPRRLVVLGAYAHWGSGGRTISAGRDGARLGDEVPSPRHVNFGRPHEADAYEEGLAPVGSHPDARSPYGVHDLAGNASEWVADWYRDSYERGDVCDPARLQEGTAKVIRGGGWYDPPQRVTAARQMFAGPTQYSDDIGFRCARDP